jgi:large subunit ribosomal protein L21
MAFAVIRSGSKQFRVSEGDKLEVELLGTEDGATTEFTDVLLVADDKGVRVGNPTVAGAKVCASVLATTQGDKVVAFKFRRRKGYHRTVGHRQKYTQVQITSIQG